ncbi:MAG: FAD-binding dehydrogenase, partial [Chitinophagaceae bacterium]|nr:FAD-binding dehydrogenase [Chitinophagaceae bacterium]
VETVLEVELRFSSKPGNHTPDTVLASQRLPIHPGRNCLQLQFDVELEEAGYAFLVFQKNPEVQLQYTHKRVTGILSVFNTVNKAVSNYGKQTPPEDIGMDAFEFWCPQRRPEGHNIAFKYPAGLDQFRAVNIRNGIDRPTYQPNAWVADWTDPNPQLTISWEKQQSIHRIDLFFDADYDHPMESVLMHHPETTMPFCVRNYRILNEAGKIIATKKDNYQTCNSLQFDEPLLTSKLIIELEHPSAEVPAALFAVRCY